VSGDRNVLFLLSMSSNKGFVVTSGNNDGNEDDTRDAFYTSSRYRTTKPLLEDIDNRNNTLRSPDTDSYVHGSLKGTSYSKCVDETMVLCTIFISIIVT
jgi:hypothetical protein